MSSDESEISKSACESTSVSDSHCHIHLNQQNTPITTITESNLHCVYGTSPDDWDTLASLQQVSTISQQSFVIGYGIHPWHAPSVERKNPTEWRNQLKEILCTPRADGRWPLVGEIGLDGAAIDRETGQALDSSLQEAVFRTQWNWAARLARGVSVHCVRSFGTVFELCRTGEAAERAQLKRNKAKARRHAPESAPSDANKDTSEQENERIMPPVVDMHSYSGSADIALQLLKMAPNRYYFGFSTAVNGRNWASTVKVIAKLPRDRVLAESDLEEESAAQSACNEIINRIAQDVWHCDVQEARRILDDNLQRFVSIHDEASSKLTPEQYRSIAASLS